MDFSIISSLSAMRSERPWWVDGLFYLSISCVAAVVLSSGIFMLRISLAKKEIAKQEAAFETVGTSQQKDEEKMVLSYQKKLNDFNQLFKNHQFASNVFDFAQDKALPYIWFKQFVLDQKNASVQFFGQTESSDNLSRQVAEFESSPYVKRVTLLNSKLSAEGKVDFNINLILDKNIFSYSADVSMLGNVTPSSEQIIEQTETE